jgi:hypothetical protein
MLTKKKISIIAKTIVDEVEIATHSALLDADTGDLSFHTRHDDKAACKEHREVVRADAAEFEDFAYSVQESVMAAH